MSDSNESIIARVKKLMAVSTERGATEAEAANAASLIQSILGAHNLTLAQVEASKRGTADETGPAPRTKQQSDRAAMYHYQRTLMAALAKNNFCMHFIHETEAHSFGKMRKVKRHVLLGSELNVQVTLLTYDYLVGTMDRRLPYTGMEKRGKAALAWLDGCADRLAERLAEKRRDAERESREAAATARHPSSATPGTALVLADVYGSEQDLNEDFLAGNPLGTTARLRIENEARFQEAKRKRQERVAKLAALHPDLEAAIIELMSFGYDRDEAVAKHTEEVKAEPKTEAQLRKERKQTERYWERQDEKARRAYAREEARKSNPVYRAGRREGDNIGLDQQVEGEKRQRLA